MLVENIKGQGSSSMSVMVMGWILAFEMFPLDSKEVFI